MKFVFTLAATLAASAFVSPLASADTAGKSNTPYIDELRKEIDARDRENAPQDPPPAATGPDPYIQSIKKKLGPAPAEPSYTQELKKELDPKPSSGGYTDSEKARLGPADSDSAIQAVTQNRSDLKEQRRGSIHHAAGLRVGLPTLPRTISAPGIQAANFSDIYAVDNSVPDVNFFYEYQPWHSEWFGSLGFVGGLGLSYYHGFGARAVKLTNPGGGEFDTKTDVKTQFFAIPVVLGVDYRFNLLRIFRPFVMAGATLIGFYETRSDNKDSHYASSRGVVVSGGVSILLDWISKSASWDMYAGSGIHHMYLTLEYSRISSFSGAVSFLSAGGYGGLSFEF